MVNVLEIRGLDELIDALARAPEVAEPVLRQAMLQSLLLVEARVAEYPEATEANRARSWQSSAYSISTRRRANLNAWYERGYGQKWVRKDGTVNGRATSRFLGRQSSRAIKEPTSWSHDVQARSGSIEGVIGNSAEYAPYVIGDKQASYHAAHGWLTLSQGALDSETEIQDRFDVALDKLVAILAG